jgi:phospholipase/carboxylesterase
VPEDPSGRAARPDRIGLAPARIGLAADRIRIGCTPFVTQPLDFTILPPSGAGPHPTILALHGMGMRPEPFARWFRGLQDAPCAWLLPEGPYPVESRVGGLRASGFAWYVYDGDTPAFRATLRRSEGRILQLLPERASTWNLDPARVILLGFSQGAYFAGSLGLRHAERFRGIVIAGGRARPGWADRAAETIPRIPFLFLHGRDDDVVPLDQARASADEIERLGFPVRFHVTEGGHAWNEEMSAALRVWTREIFADA